MNRTEQKQFVRDLSKSIADEICEAIQRRKIPVNWDGHEFRVLLKERHASSASMSLIDAEPRSARAREYRNTLTVGGVF